MAKLTDKNAFEGETLSADFTAPTTTSAVSVNLANGKVTKNLTATLEGGVWKFVASPAQIAGLVGDVRWVAYSTRTDGRVDVLANGHIYLRPLVSMYRAVVTAIDEAIQSWSTNPNHTVSVGEITITAKSVDDLIRARAYYQGRADADESGNPNAGGGPRRILTRF